MQLLGRYGHMIAMSKVLLSIRLSSINANHIFQLKRRIPLPKSYATKQTLCDKPSEHFNTKNGQVNSSILFVRPKRT